MLNQACSRVEEKTKFYTGHSGHLRKEKERKGKKEGEREEEEEREEGRGEERGE